MFNSLREELNKIALIEDEELESLEGDNKAVGGDDGAADDELFDDEDFEYEEEEDDIADDVEDGDEEPSDSEIDDVAEYLNEASDEEIDALVNQILAEEYGIEDDDLGYEYDDDQDSYADDDDYGYYNEDENEYLTEEELNMILGEDDEELDYDSEDYEDSYEDEDDSSDFDEEDDEDEELVDDSEISVDEDMDEDQEEALDGLMEAMLGECGDYVGNERQVHATQNDIFGDSADIPAGSTPPAPQYDILNARRASGREFVDFGNGNYQKYGKVFLDRDSMKNMTVDNDDYDEEGDNYDLYASAGNIYDDDENEEYYGLRDTARTSNLYGKEFTSRYSGALSDRFAGAGDALDEDYDLDYDEDEDYDTGLDESVEAFLANYLSE